MRDSISGLIGILVLFFFGVGTVAVGILVWYGILATGDQEDD